MINEWFPSKGGLVIDLFVEKGITASMFENLYCNLAAQFLVLLMIWYARMKRLESLALFKAMYM